jgi:hypothetical protein
MIEGHRTTYQTTQVLAPGTLRPIGVEIIEQHYESDQHRNQRSGSDPPPDPPQRLPALEEPKTLASDGVGFSHSGRIDRLADVIAVVIDRNVRELVRCVVADALTEGIRRMQETHSQAETHQEPADMGEVVQTR